MKAGFILLCLGASLSLSAQHNCGFDRSIDQYLRSDITLFEQLEEQEALIKRKAAARNDGNQMMTIPVVVHVMHLGEPMGVGSNISDAQIESAIKRLNEAFAGGEGFTGPEARIQFALASKSIDCRPTNGVVRIDARGTCIGLDCYDEKGITENNIEAVKDLSNWPSSQYLNIWVVTEIEDNNGGSGIQGSAEFPGLNPQYDGIVILHQAFGHDDSGQLGYSLKASASAGKVLVHEAGHSLGLYHTFEGDDYNRDGRGDRCPSYTGCGPYNGDCVADTPPHRRSNGDCQLKGINICDGGGPHSLYVHNFMNYSSQECQTEFTHGQIKRMRETLRQQRPGWIVPSSDSEVAVQEPAQGCQPQTRFLPNAFGLGVRSVTIGTTTHSSNSASEDGGYLNNWCNSFSTAAGHSYSISISTGNQNAQNVKVYCDYNGDGSFDERRELLLKSDRTKVHRGTIRIPTTAKTGRSLRLRVIAAYSGFSISNACFQPYFGQVEDYTMVVGGQALAADGHLPEGPSIAINDQVQDLDHGFTDKDFQLFPNPTTMDKVSIQASQHHSLSYDRIEILDASGRILQSQRARDIDLSQGQEIGISMLRSGLYHVRLVTDQGSFVKRLVKL